MMSPKRWLLLLLACLLMLTVSPATISGRNRTLTSLPDEANIQSIEAAISILLLDEDEVSGMTYNIYIPILRY